jgi:hypothetical protein
MNFDRFGTRFIFPFFVCLGGICWNRAAGSSNGFLWGGCEDGTTGESDEYERDERQRAELGCGEKENLGMVWCYDLRSLIDIRTHISC